MAVQSVFLRRKAWVAACLLLAVRVSAHGASSPSGLRLGTTVNGHCSGGVVTYDLDLTEGEYIRVWIESHGDLTAKVSGPNGEPIVVSELGPDAVAPISFVSGRPGPYKLELGCDHIDGSASYRLQLDSRRPASTKDRQNIVVEKAHRKAEKLARLWQEEFRRKALREFERVLASAKDIGEGALAERTQIRLGDIHLSLGEAELARKYYDAALFGAQSRSVRVDAHLGVARALLRLGRRDEALAHASEALQGSRIEGDQHREARALTTLGIVDYDLEDMHHAIEVFQRSYALWQRLSDNRGEAEALLHMGFAHSDLSEEQKALELHFVALDLARQARDRSLEALTLTAIGNVYSKLGEMQHALNFYYRATPLLESMGDLYWTVSVYSGMGYAYYELGDAQRALRYFTRAVEMNRRISSRQDEGMNLVHLGRTHLSMGHPEKALSCYRSALQIFNALGLDRMVAVALGDIAAAYDALEDADEALIYYNRALELYEVSGFKREEANTLNNLGRIEERRGRMEAAVAHYRRALTLSRETDDRFVESRSLLNLARVARTSGDLDEARRHAEKALSLVEELRANVASYSLRASYFASIHELHQFYVGLLMELDRKRPSEGFSLLAFDASERARARSLLEMLSDEPADPGALNPELLARERQLEQQIRAHSRAREQHSGRATREGSRTGSTELSELLAELDRVQAVIRSQSEHNPSFESEPASIGELQELLDPSTLLLSYFLGSEASYVWVLTRTDLSVHVLPPQEDIEVQVQRLYRLLAARERKDGETAKEFHERALASDRDFWTNALPLSRTLLGTIAGKLEGKRLVVIGDGGLLHFPFSALPIPSSDGVEPIPLIAEHEVIRLPSASILVALGARDVARPEPPKTVAVLADPVFDREDPRVEAPRRDQQESSKPYASSESAWALSRAVADVRLGEDGTIPRLLASRQEAQNISSLVPPQESLVALGFEASRSLATSGELTRYRVVHFATHGLLDTEHPELSGIILSLVDENGEPRDGFLRLHDIENLYLPVNLVVLSACSTGLGKEVQGEGMIGLVRGFMSAGADRVLASYWNVDDEATAELMKRFYRNLFTADLTPSVALRDAQRSMWTEKRWHSPFYWAAFELQGWWQ